jgi:hypothetical protein
MQNVVPEDGNMSRFEWERGQEPRQPAQARIEV